MNFFSVQRGSRSWTCLAGCLAVILIAVCAQMAQGNPVASSEEIDAVPFFSFLFGNSDVDRRSDLRASNLGNEFLGKRSGGMQVKRRPGSEFLGKRVPGSEFLGKRVPGSEFLGKRVPGSEFLGKRSSSNSRLGAADARMLRTQLGHHSMHGLSEVKRSPEEASEFGRGDRELYWNRLQQQLGRR